MNRFCIILFLFALLIPAGAIADEVFTYTPIKHATFVLQSGSTTIYVDPVGEAEAFSAFPPPDLILIRSEIGRAHV